jgi:hypothetical protein
MINLLSGMLQARLNNLRTLATVHPTRVVIYFETYNSVISMSYDYPKKFHIGEGIFSLQKLTLYRF